MRKIDIEIKIFRENICDNKKKSYICTRKTKHWAMV